MPLGDLDPLHLHRRFKGRLVNHFTSALVRSEGHLPRPSSHILPAFGCAKSFPEKLQVWWNTFFSLTKIEKQSPQSWHK